MAPASPTALTHRRHPSKPSVKSPKSSLELLDDDMIYCLSPPPVPGSEPDSPTEEVVLGNGDARYYNLTANMTIPLPGGAAGGRRRHSIGTFLSREKAGAAAKTTKKGDPERLALKVGSLKLTPGKGRDVATSPTVDGSPLDHHFRPSAHAHTHTRRRCNKCCTGRGADWKQKSTRANLRTSSHTSGRGADMDDILIVTSRQSQIAGMWISFLIKCFDQISESRKKPAYKILNLEVEDIISTGNLSVAMEEKMVRVRLQIIILCPRFLEFIYDNASSAHVLSRLLQPDRVLAMLLGVDEESITEQHKTVLTSYNQWHRLPVKDQDQSSVEDFLAEGMSILAKVSRQQLSREKAMFSVVPKKVNEGQNKVILLLNDPLEKEDQIKIKIDKNGEFLDISGFKKRNPYTLYFPVPESCLEVSMLVSVHVEKNGQNLGSRQIKCESRMRELDQLLRTADNPLQFMCQTLGFSPGDRDHLDNFLVSAFQRNLPPHFNLLHSPSVVHQHRTHASPEEYPTLLHFAARFGLEKLAWQLLECPGGEQACEIRNMCDLTPAEMAEAANHPKLANLLRGYMQMTELTSTYSYLKVISEGNQKNKGYEEVNYHVPRPLSETYQVPPSARTLVDQNYQVPPTARPYTPATSQQVTVHETEGYMEMHPGNSNNQSFPDNLDFLNMTMPLACSETSSIRSASPSDVKRKLPSQNNLDQISLETGQDEKSLRAGANIKKSTEHVNQGVQDELLEIITDFKNNVFTISEVEKLVENWKNRNDVQRSFKEKQEQLNQMREEYDRLQQHMKEQMKRPTPFDRIKVFFKRKPKDSKESSPEHTCSNNNDSKSMNLDFTACHRPVSSLSLHSISSSSSGRMSTLSACSGTSMGDSGTHSDTDDRKMLSSFDFHKTNYPKSSIQNYEIPPIPRPCVPKTSHQAVSPSSSKNFENRLPLPVPRPDVDENYVTLEVCRAHNAELMSRKSDSLSETEEKISAIISSNSSVGDKYLSHIQEVGDAEYLSLENVPDNQNVYKEVPSPSMKKNEYMNISYPPKNEAGETQNFEPTDTSDLPEYVNITLPQNTPPPILPRVPTKRST